MTGCSKATTPMMPLGEVPSINAAARSTPATPGTSCRRARNCGDSRASMLTLLDEGSVDTRTLPAVPAVMPLRIP